MCREGDKHAVPVLPKHLKQVGDSFCVNLEGIKINTECINYAKEIWGFLISSPRHKGSKQDKHTQKLGDHVQEGEF